MIREAAICVLTAALSACAASRPIDADSRDRPLLAPATLGSERSASQIVRGAFGEREATLQCAVSVRGDAMTVIGLTTLGMRAFTIRYDGVEVRHEQSLAAPSQLTPQRLLADLQLVFWPIESLQAQLKDAGWELAAPFERTRRLRRAGRLIAEVHYDGEDPWRSRSWLVNLEHDYTLSIDSQAP